MTIQQIARAVAERLGNLYVVEEVGEVACYVSIEDSGMSVAIVDNNIACWDRRDSCRFYCPLSLEGL